MWNYYLFYLFLKFPVQLIQISIAQYSVEMEILPSSFTGCDGIIIQRASLFWLTVIYQGKYLDPWPSKAYNRQHRDIFGGFSKK